MIKNRTLEFKQKYSSLQVKQKPLRDSTPDYLKNKFANTGFTDYTNQRPLNQKTAKKLAKVQSTAFIKSRTKVSQFCRQGETSSKKYLQNSTSLCRYLQSKQVTIEKRTQMRHKVTPSEVAQSQRATSDSQRFNDKGVNQIINKNVFIKELPSVEHFFSNLTPRSLFFCCKCFKYVFAIEKNLHHPKCQNEINLLEIKPKQMQQQAWQRLDMILQLSQYTNYKNAQITKLYQQLKNKQLQNFQNIIISPNVTYLGFEEIIEAFILTHQTLLRGSGYNPSGILSMKKLFACVDGKASSTVFQKKFFG